MRPAHLLQRAACTALATGSRYLAWLYLMGLVVVAAPASAQAPWTGSGVGLPAAESIPAIGLTVSDMDRSIAFYTEILPFQVEADTEVAGKAWEELTGVFGVRMRIVRLNLGAERLELTEYLAAATPGHPAPVDSRSNDHWFQHVAIIVSNMDSAYALLRSRHVRSASTAPQLLPRSIPGAAGIRAFYFRDPDGHPLEILQFPADKGDAKWHRSDALFLGIDHSAIVVSNSERSLGFYRDLLGLRVAGESHNFGDEQAHLNNVEGADLHITGLRSPAGPGIEFLEYLVPSDGRAIPADERPNDLVHWQTAVVVRDLDRLLARLDSAGVVRVSRAVSTIQDRNLGAIRGILVRDPDGHVVQLIGR